MAQHRTLATFPPAATGYPHHRALARLHADGAVVWQTAAAEIVESRETWPHERSGAWKSNDTAAFARFSISFSSSSVMRDLYASTARFVTL